MFLMSVDLPQPFVPRLHTCSPAAISRLTSFSAAQSPRMTVRFRKERSGGVTVLLTFILSKGRFILTESYGQAMQEKSNGIREPKTNRAPTFMTELLRSCFCLILEHAALRSRRAAKKRR